MLRLSRITRPTNPVRARFVKVLVACECSGVIREAFRTRGHEAWSCDLKPAEDSSPYHIQQDVRTILRSLEWDLIIAHPPCTYLTNSSSGHFARQVGRHDSAVEAVEFFKIFQDERFKKICIENPIPMRWVTRKVGMYDQIIRGSQFGHQELRRSCLWLRGLPNLIPTHDLGIPATRRERVKWQNVAYMGNRPNRASDRSRTLPGIAEAMASQWG